MNPRPLRIAVQALAIVIVGGAAAALHATFRPISMYNPQAAPAPSPSGGGTVSTGPTSSTGTTAPGDTGTEQARITDISLEKAHELYDGGQVVFIDARELEDYEKAHVPGAFWLPFSKFFSGKPPAVTQDLPQDVPIVVYCEGGDCHASHQVAEMLLEYGFTDLRVLGAGWPGWEEAGYPKESGKPLYGS